MHVKVHYQNLDGSPWIDQFIEKKICRLEKYLGSISHIVVYVSQEDQRYITRLQVRNRMNEFDFDGEGQILYESFSVALNKAIKGLRAHHMMIKNKIYKERFSIQDENFT